MKKELEKTYNPSDIEDRLYKKWMDKKYFHAEVDRSRKPFTIVMPPPNITGQLHMGHALDNTLQDILIRFKRMQGYNALWIPGTDHASIATEAKIVEAMRKARKKEYNNVNELMKKGEQRMLEGQRIHAQMLQKSASKDDNLEINLLLIHSEDQMSSVETISVIAEEYIALCKEIL